jgi:hypothetical protein
MGRQLGDARTPALDHFENTKTCPLSLNVIVGSAKVAITESPVDALRTIRESPFTAYVPVLPELSATVPELVVVVL